MSPFKPDSFPSVEDTPDPEKESKGISEAESFDELYSILERMGEIQGSSEKYATEELKARIETARKIVRLVKKQGGTVDSMNPKILQPITGGEGLRDKVRELLEKEESPE